MRTTRASHQQPFRYRRVVLQRFKDRRISNGRNTWTVTGELTNEGVRLKKIHGDINDNDGLKEALCREFGIVL